MHKPIILKAESSNSTCPFYDFNFASRSTVLKNMLLVMHNCITTTFWGEKVSLNTTPECSLPHFYLFTFRSVSYQAVRSISLIKDAHFKTGENKPSTYIQCKTFEFRLR